MIEKAIQNELSEMADQRDETLTFITKNGHPTLVDSNGIEPEWVRKSHSYWQSARFEIFVEDEKHYFDDGCCRGGCGDYCCRVRG